MNRVCWNIRGTGNKDSRRKLNRMVKEVKAKYVCILEPLNNPTKMASLGLHSECQIICLILWPRRKFGYFGIQIVLLF